MQIEELTAEKGCPECGSDLKIEVRDLENFTQKIIKCTKCKFELICPPKEKEEEKVEIPIDEKGESNLFPKIGVSTKEKRRIYRKSPAGKAAWERYRRSPLFQEAHRRHRETEKYKETQKRFHEKRKLWRKILKNEEDEIREYTCPLKLFWIKNGIVINNQDLCNIDENGCCKFGCTY